MKLPYNETLNQEDRKLFTTRLLKLYDIIADAPEEQYDHRQYTRQNGLWRRLRTGCGTAACAIGHACLHADQFPGFDVIDIRQAAPTLVSQGKVDPLVPTPQAKSYFGPNSFAFIFALDAYEKPDGEVTKYDALNRIEHYITDHLGCQLIPA